MKIWAGLAVLLSIAVAGAFGAGPSPAAAHDYDCADFANQAEAEEYLTPGDPNRLDADSDGIACEDLPCPCSSSPGSGSGESTIPDPAPAPPKPAYHLRIPTAARISMRLIAGVVRRSSSLDSYSVTVCRRIAERSVNCRLSAKGESIHQRVACRYGVAVRAKNRHPRGRIVSHKCRRSG